MIKMQATIQLTNKRTINKLSIQKNDFLRSIDDSITSVRIKLSSLTNVNISDDEMLAKILGLPIKQIENYGTLQCQLTQNPNNKEIVYCEGPSITCEYRAKNNVCKYFEMEVI
ncbi:MAG: hypothetical protein ABIC91_08660 [Nanoarchaeota archaeon]|nr:hypothetical protein [Nanoarchaeota archaeon]MBU1030293.1 hypothetical protein [Nanoarchaeota archaeon]MBU1849306.1 hypothetical protein [Nanoarchaeota archaeon]